MESRHVIWASDIAGLGKVATLAALPILAACQLEVAVLPTVILSSHTGGFPHVYRENYQEGMTAFLRQWQELEVEFSALLVGYLGSEKQLDILATFATEQELPLLLDPIMGDGGRLYKGFDLSYVEKMRQLCPQAQLILPNLTEACFLADFPYPQGLMTAEDLKALLEKLRDLTAGHILVTGIPLTEHTLSVAYLAAGEEELQLFSRPLIPGYFSGAGDILTALVVAAYLQGKDLATFLPRALDFLEAGIRATCKRGGNSQYGIFYQPFLGEILNMFRD